MWMLIGLLLTPRLAAASVGGCGDGVLDEGEACDDGDALAGDGCSADCAVELGWVCATPDLRIGGAETATASASWPADRPPHWKLDLGARTIRQEAADSLPSAWLTLLPTNAEQLVIQLMSREPGGASTATATACSTGPRPPRPASTPPTPTATATACSTMKSSPGACRPPWQTPTATGAATMTRRVERR